MLTVLICAFDNAGPWQSARESWISTENTDLWRIGHLSHICLQCSMSGWMNKVAFWSNPTYICRSKNVSGFCWSYMICSIGSEIVFVLVIHIYTDFVLKTKSSTSFRSFCYREMAPIPKCDSYLVNSFYTCILPVWNVTVNIGSTLMWFIVDWVKHSTLNI